MLVFKYRIKHEIIISSLVEGLAKLRRSFAPHLRHSQALFLSKKASYILALVNLYLDVDRFSKLLFCCRVKYELGLNFFGLICDWNCNLNTESAPELAIQNERMRAILFRNVWRNAHYFCVCRPLHIGPVFNLELKVVRLARAHECLCLVLFSNFVVRLALK